MGQPGTGSTNQSLTFAAAKKLAGKAHTSNLKEIYNETIPSSVQIGTSFIFGEDIPQTVTTDTLYQRFSSSAGADPTVEYVEFYVQSIAGTTYDANDGTFGDVGFGGGDEAQAPGPHGYQLVLTSSYESLSSNPNTGSGFLVNNQVIHQSNGGLQLVNPSFGPQTGNNYGLTLYTGHPASGGLQIPTTSPIEWLVDYFNGTIFVQDYIASAVPTYARGFIYIGKTAKTMITEASSSGGGGGGDLSITGDTGSDTVTVGTDTLNFSGSNGIDTTVSTDKVSIEVSFDNLVDVGSGVAFGDSVAISDANDSGAIKKATFTNIANLHAGAVATTGLVNNQATLEINVTGLNANTAANDADTIIVDDGDSGANTKMTRGNFLGSQLAKFNNGLTATTISGSSTLQIGGQSTFSSDLTVTGSVKVTTLGAQNEILIVGADNALSSSNLLTIDTANQRIGVGTTSPEVKLHLDGNAAQEAQIRLEQHNNSADAPDIRFRRSRGTHDSPSTLNAGDYLARVNVDVWDGASYTSAGQFRWDNDGTTNNNATNTVFGLQTRSSGSTQDRITVDKHGNVTFSGSIGIGVSGSSITHAITLPNNSDVTGRAKANSYLTYSSIRYKKEVKPLVDPIKTLKKLNGVSYVWKDTNTLDFGFIAEEVGKVLPEIIDWAQDGKHANSMDYIRLISFLVEGVKEQDKKIESLEEKVNLLIEKVNKLDIK